MIIGLTGKKESGKDTAGQYLVKQYGFERRAFADPLKKSVAALLGIPLEEVDKYKLESGTYVTLEGEDEMGITVDIMSRLSFREFLQRYGTESHREVFGLDFWVDQTLPVGGFYAGRKIVLTDVRFENETVRVFELGGMTVRLVRPDTDNSGDQHMSEQENYAVDFTIRNDGTIEDLYRKLDELLASVSVME